MKKFKVSLFIFRNDLRLEDNTALISSLKDSDLVIPVFIFNKKQISSENEYRSLNSMLFLKNCLIDLNEKLEKIGSRLFMFYDKIDNVISNINKKIKIDALYFNKDYTPFSRGRDKQIEDFCLNNNIDFFSFHDRLLLEPLRSLKENKKPYTIFTPFFRKNSLEKIDFPEKNEFDNYYKLENLNAFQKKEFDFEILDFPEEFNYENLNIFQKGGRDELKLILEKQVKNLNNYNEIRNFPFLSGTSNLSAHLKFGTISVRELYYFVKDGLGEEHPLIRQLFWRDFFYSIGYFFPKVFGNSFLDKYNDINWDNDLNKFEAWKLGKTGFPIVDAGMRELNQTGFMHNRLRMIVSSFLVKDLRIDWRLGERYFASKLIDYDPMLNNGNWQWAASTGCDAQPYFRIFNPWRQGEKFDKDCVYIKKWVPELRNLDSKIIHTIWKFDISNYLKPIVEHDIESKITKDLFKNKTF